MTNWIKTSERLPEVGKEVLVYYKGNEIPIQAFYTNRWRASSELLWHIVNDLVGYDTELISQELITLWCELPELPKEGEKF